MFSPVTTVLKTATGSSTQYNVLEKSQFNHISLNWSSFSFAVLPVRFLYFLRQPCPSNRSALYVEPDFTGINARKRPLDRFDYSLSCLQINNISFFLSLLSNRSGNPLGRRKITLLCTSPSKNSLRLMKGFVTGMEGIATKGNKTFSAALNVFMFS